MAFNDNANPKVKTEKFKIYIDVSATTTPAWELQGRGVESWTVVQNQDIDKKVDVLGLIDMTRGTAQPAQSGVSLALRKGSAFAEMLFDAWYSGDYSKLDNISILQKFEFKDGESLTIDDPVKARLASGCMISINSFNGEAGGNLLFDIDIHYSNQFTTGEMALDDGTTVTFVPDDT